MRNQAEVAADPDPPLSAAHPARHARKRPICRSAVSVQKCLLCINWLISWKSTSHHKSLDASVELLVRTLYSDEHRAQGESLSFAWKGMLSACVGMKCLLFLPWRKALPRTWALTMLFRSIDDSGFLQEQAARRSGGCSYPAVPRWEERSQLLLQYRTKHLTGLLISSPASLQQNTSPSAPETWAWCPREAGMPHDTFQLHLLILHILFLVLDNTIENPIEKLKREGNLPPKWVLAGQINFSHTADFSLFLRLHGSPFKGCLEHLDAQVLQNQWKPESKSYRWLCKLAP